jgi:hypothetical protein
MRQRLLGEAHPAVATSLHNLAELYAKQAQFEKQRRFWSRLYGYCESCWVMSIPALKSSSRIWNRSKPL